MKEIEDLEIENVVLYIGDAVRYDYLHPEIDQRGVTFKTISQSIHTPPSFASIFTGCIPPKHGVFWFSSKLPESLPSLLTLENHRTHFAHTNTALERSDGGMLADLLRGEDAGNENLNSFTSQFVWTERGPGGHAPYGNESQVDTGPYFSRILPAAEEVLRQQYEKAIERDNTIFQERLDTLADRDLLDSTLVIYASDHGEMLGEDGLVGHNEPITSELTYTPTVFIHPDLPDKNAGIMRGVDLYPTIRKVLGYVSQEYTDGKPVDELSGPIRGTVHYQHAFDITRRYGEKYTFLGRFIPMFDQHGVFDGDGGRVRRFNSTLGQLSIVSGNLLISTVRRQYRANFISVIKKYLKNKWTCGLPNFSWKTADQTINASRSAGPIGEVDRSEIDEEQLESLGYV